MDTFPKDDPDLRLVEPNWYRLESNYRYQWGKDGQEYELTVFSGFECDLASIPKAVHWYIGPQDLGLGPPLFHDLFYACQGEITDYEWGQHRKVVRENGVTVWDPVGEDWERDHVDRLFGRHMRESGVNIFRRRMAYRVVSWFGFKAWWNKRDGDEKP